MCTMKCLESQRKINYIERRLSKYLWYTATMCFLFPCSITRSSIGPNYYNFEVIMSKNDVSRHPQQLSRDMEISAICVGGGATGAADPKVCSLHPPRKDMWIPVRGQRRQRREPPTRLPPFGKLQSFPAWDWDFHSDASACLARIRGRMTKINCMVDGSLPQLRAGAHTSLSRPDINCP